MKKQDFFGEKAMNFWGKPVEKPRAFMGKSDGKKGVLENDFSVFHIGARSKKYQRRRACVDIFRILRFIVFR